MRVLVTGGAGYIGSHTVLSLIEHGHEPIVVDNLCNSSAESLRRVENISGTSVEFHEFDVSDSDRLTALLDENPVEAVIHFAGLKAVGESVEKPLTYYRNNLDTTMSVVEALQATSSSTKPARIIFSSSATVYGDPGVLPYIESLPTGIDLASPYAQSKYMCEEILRDVCHAVSDFQAISLRYFNPIGAHPSGDIGEDPSQIPNNLAPYITQVAVGRLERLGVFGNDYPTRDGTGVRDYIHVMDVAEGHIAALNFITPGFHAVNLGTGQGTSVMELVHAFETASGVKIPYEVKPRRDGDLAEYFASADLAANTFGWRAQRSVEEACHDAWNWQSKNPHGFSTV